MLRTLLASVEDPPAGHDLPAWLRPHQAEAVARACAILRRWNGVLVADGVGLGKTYIALALAELERRKGGCAVALVPATLCEEWRRAASSVDVPIAIVSHTALARRGVAPPSRCSMLLVDEAHAFRNPATRRYDALARLAINRSVVLLTATPINNSASDLASLLALFAAPDRFRELGVADICGSLRRGDRRTNLALAALTICRTRRLVETRFPVLRRTFPRRRLLPTTTYDLNAAYGGCLKAVLTELQSLAGDDEPGALLRLSLLRRLESSRAALRRSLRRHRAFLIECLRAHSEGRRLSHRAFARNVPRTDSDDMQLVWWGLLIPGEPAPARLMDSVRASLESVQRALEVIEMIPDIADSKAQSLDRLLSTTLAGRKTIVFTEHRDTAQYLYRRLAAHQRAVLVTGPDSWMGRERVARTEALDAFAPHARGARTNPLLRADILVATDVASEGLNLQDAAAVVSYDLPWNPVRVMQRVGRIDRMGSPHEEILVGQCLPDGGLADMTGVLTRLREKLGHVGPASEPDPLAAVWWLDRGLTPSDVERESWRRVAPFESRERWRAALDGCPPPWQRAVATDRGPLVAAGLACDDLPPQAGLLFALEWRNGQQVPLGFVATAGAQPRSDPDALGALAERALKARPLPGDAAAFTDIVTAVLPMARAALVELSAQRTGARQPAPGRVAAVTALERGAAARATGRLDNSEIAAALRALRRDLPAGLDRLLARLAADSPHPEQLAKRILEILASSPTASPQRDPDGPPRLTLVAALVLAVEGPC